MKNLIIKSLITFVILNSSFVIGYSQSWKELMDSTKFYEDKQDYPTALHWAKLELPQLEKKFGKKDSNYITTLGRVAKLFYFNGSLDSAVYYADRRLTISRELYKVDNPDLASCINSLAFYYKAKGDYDKVEALYKESIKMRRRLFKGGNSDLAKSINNLAIFYQEQGNDNSAEPLFVEALQMISQIYKEDNNDLARIITSVGNFYYKKGDYQKAEPLLKSALDMRRRLFKTDHPDLAKSISNLAAFYDAYGNNREAEPLLKEALEMGRRLYKVDNQDLAISINNLATFYSDNGDFKKAKPLFIEALEMRRRMSKGDNPNLACSINNLANFYYNQSDYKQAEALFNEALDMNRRIYKSDNSNLASSINNIANYYDIIGDYKKAEPLFVEALQMYRRIYKDDHPDLATGINNMAGFYQDRGDFEQAEKLFKESLEMRKRLFKGNHSDLAISLNNLADFYELIGDSKQAENFYKEGLGVYKNMLDNYFPSLSENEKNLFWNTVSNRYEAFNSFGAKRFSDNPLIACTMYDVRLYTKAMLFNSTTRIKNRIMNSNDLNLIDKYNEFTGKRNFLVKLYSMTEMARKKKNINIDSIELVVNNLEKELSLMSELYPQRYDQIKVTWKSIQGLLNPDEAAVEVIRYRNREKNIFTDTICYAFLIITDQMDEHPDLVILKNGLELETNYYNDYRFKIGSKLVDKLSFSRYWEKLYEKLKGFKKIYFSADGIYNKLNPATLLMPNGKYLIEEQDIQQVNSTKDLIIGYQKSKVESNIYNSAVLIGNPNFSLSETKVKEATLKTKSNSDLENSYEKIASRRGIDLSRLPGTEKEIKDIEMFLKGKNWVVTSYLGDKALKTVIKSVFNPRILHIATHGMFLEDIDLAKKATLGFETKKVVDNPLLRSGLFFTGADDFLNSDSTKPITDENGLLTAYEAMNLDLDKTELVVLSACETGLGDVKNGEGVFGLRRAFQQAGAKSVIMSLWTVSDETTQKLMSSFYKNWVMGMTKREAFSLAQKDVRTEFKEPYYWGAFVMVGE